MPKAPSSALTGTHQKKNRNTEIHLWGLKVLGPTCSRKTGYQWNHTTIRAISWSQRCMGSRGSEAPTQKKCLCPTNNQHHPASSSPLKEKEEPFWASNRIFGFVLATKRTSPLSHLLLSRRLVSLLGRHFYLFICSTSEGCQWNCTTEQGLPNIQWCFTTYKQLHIKAKICPYHSHVCM